MSISDVSEQDGFEVACASQDHPVLAAPQPGMSVPVESICYHMQATAAGLVKGARPDADHLGVTLTPRPGGIARSRQDFKNDTIP